MTHQHDSANRPLKVQSIGMLVWVALAVCAILPIGSAHAWTFKEVHLFCRQVNCIDGQAPQQKLLTDSTGNLYGTAGGGANQEGIVFMLSPKTGGKGWAYKVLYHFCHLASCKDGASPGGSWLIRDVAGNIYGTTSAGGKYGNGTVFRLSPGSRKRWSFDVVYNFCRKDNCADGKFPSGGLSYVGMATGVAYDGTSALYGVAYQGGKTGGGVVFSLTPQAGDLWSEAELYAFCKQKGCKDGVFPQGGVTPDAGGNLFGATFSGGGNSAQGVAYKLTYDVQRGAWQETVLHSFCAQQSCADGYSPTSGLVLDGEGNLFGTSQFGGVGGVCFSNDSCGLVFKIASDGTFSNLYSFCSESGCMDGAQPIDQGGLIVDGAGNVYGTTSMCGEYGYCPYGYGGTVFKLNGSTLETLYNFCQVENCQDGRNPSAGLVQDPVGNLFGTTSFGGINGYYGTVFELSP